MEMNGIEPFSATLIAVVHQNELLQYSKYVVYHKKSTLSSKIRARGPLSGFPGT